MKAELFLENIGQKLGKETLIFNSGVVTLISGRSASGKSRIVKSCALALSYPITSKELIKEAIKFGIIKDKKAQYSPLVNSNKGIAVISLNYGEIFKNLELKRDGDIKTNNPGNHKFLYSSVIVRNSKIQEHIVQGKSDFSWIVTEMSFAKDYNKVLEIVNSYLEQINLSKNEVNDKVKEKQKILSKIEDLDSKKNGLTAEIEKLERNIDDIKLDPELNERRIEIEKKIKNIQSEIKEKNKDLKKLKQDISEFEKDIDNKRKRVESNRSKILELTKKKDIIEKINIKSIQGEIIEIQNTIAHFRERLGGFKNEKKLWNELNIKEECVCPVCQEGKLSPETVMKNRKEIKENIKKIEAKIKKNNDDINEKQKVIKNKEVLPSLRKEIKNYEDESYNLIESLNSYKERIDEKNKKISAYKEAINTDNNELNELNKRLAPIEKELLKNEQIKPLIKKKGEFDKKLGAIEEEISRLNDNNETANFFILFDNKINIKNAKKAINDLENLLIMIRDYLKKHIDEQREGAGRKFNNNIKSLIKELNFSEFQEIALDLETYNLKVTRMDNTIQSISSLSGSERGIVAALLQICAKETYLPDIPFLIGDDIIMDIDPSRSEIFLDYLKNLAEKNDWFIILTKVTEEDLKILEI